MKKWTKAATVRAIKTAAQAAIGAIGSATLLNAVDWKDVVGTALLAAIVSYLMSTAGLPEVDGDGGDK